jgi:hypothetical protein
MPFSDINEHKCDSAVLCTRAKVKKKRFGKNIPVYILPTKTMRIPHQCDDNDH